MPEELNNLPEELVPGVDSAALAFPDTQDLERVTSAVLASKDAKAKKFMLEKLIEAMNDNPWGESSNQ